MKSLTQSLQESILDVNTNIKSANQSIENYNKVIRILTEFEKDLFKFKDHKYELKTEDDADPKHNYMHYMIQVHAPVAGEFAQRLIPISDKNIPESILKATQKYYARLFSDFKSDMYEICDFLGLPQTGVKVTRSNSLKDSYIYNGDMGLNQILFGFKNGYIEVYLGKPFIPQFKDVMQKCGVVQGSW